MTLELVLFTLVEGADEMAFLESLGPTNRWLAEQPGYRSRRTFRATDGWWVDIAEWASLSQAESAAAGFMEAPEARVFESFIAPESVIFLHLDDPVVEHLHLKDAHAAR